MLQFRLRTRVRLVFFIGSSPAGLCASRRGGGPCDLSADRPCAVLHHHRAPGGASRLCIRDLALTVE
eukprot:scaffold11645_cov60-Phaeocystis_antarctica.AAC.2